MPLAVHSLLDFHGCDPARLHDAAGLRQAMLDAIAEAGGTYVTDVFHAFSPHGLSGIVVIAESHVALHTWPELHFAAVDIFSCSPALRQEMIQARLQEWLGSERVTVDKRSRGDKYPIPPVTRADVAE
jgi:S-adenosylmethionine decarboxylase